MSINNLADHLSWLLSSKPFLPPKGLTQPSVRLDTVQFSEQVGTPVQHDTFAQSVVERTALEDIRAGVDEAGREENSGMAKLRGTPSPGKKPRLLTQDASPNHNKKGNSQHLLGIEDPRRLYPDAFSKHIKPIQDFHVDPSEATPTVKLSSKPLRTVFSPDIDTVDLTGEQSSADSRHKTIKGTSEKTIVDTPLNGKKYLTSQKAGRKRNSDEFLQDMPSTAKAPKPMKLPPARPVDELSDTEFACIDDVMNDPPPPYSTTAPNVPQKSQADDSYSKYYSHSSRSQTPLNEGRLQNKHQRPTTPAPVVTQQQKEPIGTRTIADSDEEDAELAAMEIDSDFELSEKETRPVTPPKAISQSPLKLQTPSRTNIQEVRRTKDQSPQPKFTFPATSSTSSNDVFRSKEPSATPCLNTKADVQMELFKDSPQCIVSLAKWTNSMLQAYYDQLTMQSKACSKMYVEALDEDDEVDPALERQRRNLVGKVDAMRRLINVRQQYCDKSEAKRDITRQIAESAQEDVDIPTSLMAENRAFREALRADVTTLVPLIELSGVLLFDASVQTKHDGGPSDIAVHSTQMAPPSRSNQPNVIPDSSFVQTQYVKQTQSHSSHSTSIIDSTHRPMPPVQPSPRRQPAGHPTRDKQTPNGRSAFSYNMDSPGGSLDSGEDDNFGQEDDDADMLEAVEDIEHWTSNPTAALSIRKRKALEEGSGNVAPKSNGKVSRFAPLKFKNNPELQHPWSDDVVAAMRNRFHLTGFRPHQLEAINATLSGKDVFVLMPTGGGKSLCYQLPSIIRSGRSKGVTVVASPLVSLMEDQMAHLKKLDIQVLQYNANTSDEQRRMITDAFKDKIPEDFVEILYVTPEMLSKSTKLTDGFQTLYKKGKLARFVIDEAHCVSQWGHDFRPDYKALGELRQQFPGVPVMALTATATENVKVDTIHNLNIRGCITLSQSFNRPNLYYEVRPKSRDVLKDIASIIRQKHLHESGIIYCLSRKKCEEIAEKLCEEHNIKAHHYHAMMSYEEKCDVQKRWQAGQFHVIVATIAFGMGIDKPNVRYVIHHGIPKSLEGYYQETGRAGRDGEKSHCYLFFGFQDVIIQQHFIDEAKDASKEQRERLQHMLRNVTQFCENKSDCRRVQILQYFNEKFSKEDCQRYCDNCKSDAKFENQDFTNYASLAVKLVEGIEECDAKVTLLHCVDVFRGANLKRIRDLEHDQLPEFAKAAEVDRNDLERLFYRLISENALREDNQVNRAGFTTKYICLGRKARDFKLGRKPVSIQVRITPSKNKPALRKVTDKAGKAKSKRGNAASKGTDQPLSTNIPTPRSGPTNLHLGTYRYDDEDEEEEGENDAPLTHKRNGYARDGFCVSDRLEPDSEDNSDNAFESAPRSSPVVNKSRRRKKSSLSAPITGNNQIDELSETHQMVVEDFLVRGKEKCRQILIAKNLRQVPFTDSMLRQMAIDFPKTAVEMQQIPGIDFEKVELYAKHLLPLIKQAQDHYEELLSHNHKPADPNRRNVIDLCDDEEDIAREMMEDYCPSSQEDQESPYFTEINPRVAAFNAQYNEAAPSRVIAAASKSSRATRNDYSQDPDSPGRVRKSRGGGKNKRGNSTGASRSSASFDKSRGGRKNGSGGRPSGPPKRFQKKSAGRGSRGGAGAGQRTFMSNNGGIGMMPT